MGVTFRSFVPLMFVVASSGCGARSSLDDLASIGVDGTGGAPAPPPPPPPSDGGSPPMPTPLCNGEPDLLPAVVADLDEEGGLHDRPTFVSAEDHDGIVSMFDTWSPDDGATWSIHVTTMEPWTTWPPTFDTHFTFVDDAGPALSVQSIGPGLVHVLLQHMNYPDEHLAFSAVTSAEIPSELHDQPVQAKVAGVSLPLETPLGLTRGYDTPPISCDQGYLGTMGLWNAPRDMISSALRMGVWSSECGENAGVVTLPHTDIACGTDLVGRALRQSDGWLVVSSSGTDNYRDCHDDNYLPTDLVLTRVAWGPPDEVTWTIERVATQRGDTPILDLRLATAAGRTYVLVEHFWDSASLELSRIDADLTIEDPIEIGPAGWFGMDIAALADGILIAYPDAEDGALVDVELYDLDLKRVARSTVEASGPASNVAILASPSGHSAIIGWRADTPGGAQIEMTRLDCGATAP